MSLERAAEQVDVSKKSLDDYLAQLRAGRRFGYDFNANKDKKVGDLRRFVKDKLDKLGAMKRESKSGKNGKSKAAPTTTAKLQSQHK
jgi:hypothetical protein